MENNKDINFKAKDLPDAMFLTAEDFAALLPELDDIVKWANEVKAFALAEAIKGVKIKGYKVVEGRSNRRLTDEASVVASLIKGGYDEALLYDRKLKTLGNLEKLVGKKGFEELAGDFVEKPAGAPTLVSEDDKRPEYSPEAAAVNDFDDDYEDE